MTGGEKVLIVGAIGIGAIAFYKYRSNPNNMPVSPPGPKTLKDKILGAIWSSSKWVPGASDPTTFAGQNKVEKRIAADAGKIAPAIVGKIPVFGPPLAIVAGTDTQVNVTQAERAVHGVGDIFRGGYKTGTVNIVKSGVTTAVQPIKSAGTAVVHFLSGL